MTTAPALKENEKMSHAYRRLNKNILFVNLVYLRVISRQICSLSFCCTCPSSPTFCSYRKIACRGSPHGIILTVAEHPPWCFLSFLFHWLFLFFSSFLQLQKPSKEMEAKWSSSSLQNPLHLFFLKDNSFTEIQFIHLKYTIQ